MREIRSPLDGIPSPFGRVAVGVTPPPAIIQPTLLPLAEYSAAYPLGAPTLATLYNSFLIMGVE